MILSNTDSWNVLKQQAINLLTPQSALIICQRLTSDQ